MSTTVKFALAIITVASISMLARLTGSPRDDGEQKKRPEKQTENPLAGGYTIVSGEMDGKEIPSEHVRGSTVIISPERIVSTDKDKKEFFSATYELTSKDMPWRIKMHSTNPKDGDAEGLAKKEGNTLTIVYSIRGAAAPTEFRTKENQHLFVMKPLMGAGSPE